MKTKKNTRYVIRTYDDYWFVDRKLTDYTDLLPTDNYSNVRICRTSAKCWRIVNSLAYDGHSLHVEKRWTEKGRRRSREWECKTLNPREDEIRLQK
jgi:hypothetical protein